MAIIEDQPAPKPSTRTPAWELVVKYISNNYRDDENDGNVLKVIEDGRKRDALGRERYGVPLAAGNGRDSMIDAYQELLDSAAYLRTELNEHGIDPDRKWSVKAIKALPLRQRVAFETFMIVVDILIEFRGTL